MENNVIKKKITIADDDPGIRDIVRLILERLGYEVTAFQSADALMEKQLEVPDLFLLDKQLPGMDGLELCKHLHKETVYESVPIIMISASPQIKELARLAGATDALEKPFEIRQLREMVKKYIG
jgi:CheY-like chemotaxis protein